MKIILNFIKSGSIRLKLAIVITLLIGLISVFIFLYFPERLEQKQLETIEAKAKSISDMAAFSIGSALQCQDTQSIKEAFAATKQNRSLVYLAVTDDSNRVVESFEHYGAFKGYFAGFGGDSRTKVGSQIGDIYRVTTDIRSESGNIGRLFMGFSLKELRREVKQTQTTIALVSIALFLIGMFLVFGISTLITNPLRSIVKTVEQIAKGDLTKRAPVSANDEVGQLAKSFNLMVDNLQSAYQKMEDMNKNLEMRVDERTKELQQEVNEHKQTEAALRESEQKYRTIFEGSRDAVYITTRAGDIVRVNNAFLNMFGLANDEIETHKAQDFYANPKDREKITRLIEENGYVKSFEVKMRKKNGNLIDCLMTSNAWCDKAENLIGYHGMIIDITDRKRAEQTLHKLNRSLKALSSCNEVLVRATEEKDLLNEICRMIVEVGKYRLAWVGYAEDNEEKAVRPVAQAGNAENYLESIKITWSDSDLGQGPGGTAIRTGKPCVAQNILTDPKYTPWRDQAVKSELASTISIPLISQGQSFGVLNIYAGEPDAFDVEEVKLLTELADDLAYGIMALRTRVEQKRAESEVRKLNEQLEQRVKVRTCELEQAYEQLRKTKEQFYQAQKMESVGILAGGIAHDFNNLLATIMGNISLAKMMTKPEDKMFTVLTRAEKESLRAKDLTQQLLTFSKGGTPVKKIVAIPKIIKESANIALRGSKVSCDVSLPDGLWPVEADEGQLIQAINNIIINADQAMPDGGIIKVQVENIQSDGSNGLKLPEGTYVKISIQDQGVGISEENLAKIFDPFFTTKPKGTGLGLTTAYSIVKKHNGVIKADSKIGTGTTFQIYLPASQQEIHESQKGIELPEAVPSTLTNRGNILVMDDEATVRETTKDILTHFGYEVICAGDGAETINYYRKAKESGHPFDLVIMDLTIKGGMGGKEALDELIKYDPKVKSIVSSGYSNDPIMADYKKYGFCGFVTKPYKVEELIKTLNQVLAVDLKPNPVIPVIKELKSAKAELGQDTKII
jgi:PAS domain S-box-containing protein